MSLAGRPSNIGTGFHNFLYAELGLDFVYKAFTTTDLAAAIAGIRAPWHPWVRGLDAVQGGLHRARG
jgi:shikimate 5-dehydrogenase